MKYFLTLTIAWIMLAAAFTAAQPPKVARDLRATAASGNSEPTTLLANGEN